MTRDEAREFAKLVQAYADGKRVQLHLDDGSWHDLNDPDFYSRTMKFFRIKPEPREPRECWVTFHKGGWPIWAYASEQDAIEDSRVFACGPCVHMREVTP